MDAATDAEYDIMVISSIEDESKVKTLKNLMKNFDEKLWNRKLKFYRKILPGMNLFQYLQDGLEKSQYVFAFLDDGAQPDSWNQYQQHAALQQKVRDHQKYIVPVKQHDDTPIPLFLQMYHVLDIPALLKGKRIEQVDAESLTADDINVDLMKTLVDAIHSKEENITDCLTEHSWLHRTGDRLGEGSFGQVFVVQHTLDGSRYAVKRLENCDMGVKEVKLMCELDHSNICRYYNAWQESGRVHIRMELCDMDLGTWIKRRNKLLFQTGHEPEPRDQILKEEWLSLDSDWRAESQANANGTSSQQTWFKGVGARGTNYFLKGLLQGIRYLHGRRLAHQDLYSKNVLLKFSKDQNVVTAKICDFGLSSKKMATSSASVIDVFSEDLESVGKIMVRMYYPLSGDANIDELCSKLQKSNINHSTQLNAGFPKMWPDQASWIRRLLSREPKPPAAEILDEGRL